MISYHDKTRQWHPPFHHCPPRSFEVSRILLPISLGRDSPQLLGALKFYSYPQRRHTLFQASIRVVDNGPAMAATVRCSPLTPPLLPPVRGDPIVTDHRVCRGPPAGRVPARGVATAGVSSHHPRGQRERHTALSLQQNQPPSPDTTPPFNGNDT